MNFVKFLALLAFAGVLVILGMRFNGNAAVHGMESLVAEFPLTVHNDDGTEKALTDVAPNIGRSSSLITPIVGTISFSETSHQGNEPQYEMSFHWGTGKWEFDGLKSIADDSKQKVYSTRMLATPEMYSFTHYGKVRTDVVKVQTAVAKERGEKEVSMKQQLEWEALPKWDRFGKPINRVPPGGTSTGVATDAPGTAPRDLANLPTIPLVPRKTPTPQEAAAEIARKYGAK